MLYGTIVSYFPDKKFGFIRPDGEDSDVERGRSSGPARTRGPRSDSARDVFFHISAVDVEGVHPEIRPDHPVKYELVPWAEMVAAAEEGKGKHPSEQQKAKRVLLIDKLPGAKIASSDGNMTAPRHRHARKKKPTWRR